MSVASLQAGPRKERPKLWEERGEMMVRVWKRGKKGKAEGLLTGY